MMYELISLIFDRETRKSNLVNLAMKKTFAAQRFDYAYKLGEWYRKQLKEGSIKSDAYTSSVLTNLGLAYLMRGQLEERVELGKEMLNLPSDSLDKVSRNLCKQTTLYSEFLLGDWKSALPKLRKLKGDLKHLKNNPASILIHEEDKYLKDSIKSARKLASLGLESCYQKLGYINVTLRRYTRAEKNYEQALEISRSFNGFRHVDNTCYQLSLVELYLADGRHEEAEKLMEEVLYMRLKFKSRNSLAVANAFLAKGKCHLVAGQVNEAEQCFKQVEKIYQRVNKQFRYLDMAFLFEAQAALEYKKSNYEACQKLISKAISEFESTFAPLHPLSLGALELNSMCLKKLDRVAEAGKVDKTIRKIRDITCIREVSHEFRLDEAA